MADKQVPSNTKSGTNASPDKTKKKRILTLNSSDSEVESKKQATADVGATPGNAHTKVESACQLCSTLLPRLEAMEKNHTNLLNRLTQEVMLLRKELNAGGDHKVDIALNNTRNHVLPERPFSKLVDFIEFEKKLVGNSAKQEELIKELKNLPRYNAAKFVRNAWKRIMDDELSTLFQWRGTKTKRSLVVLTTTTTFRTAFMQQFVGVEDDFFERATTNWFNSSTDRVNKELQIQSDLSKTN